MMKKVMLNAPLEFTTLRRFENSIAHFGNTHINTTVASRRLLSKENSLLFPFILRHWLARCNCICSKITVNSTRVNTVDRNRNQLLSSFIYKLSYARAYLLVANALIGVCFQLNNLNFNGFWFWQLSGPFYNRNSSEVYAGSVKFGVMVLEWTVVKLSGSSGRPPGNRNDWNGSDVET